MFSAEEVTGSEHPGGKDVGLPQMNEKIIQHKKPPPPKKKTNKQTNKHFLDVQFNLLPSYTTKKQ